MKPRLAELENGIIQYDINIDAFVLHIAIPVLESSEETLRMVENVTESFKQEIKKQREGK